MRQSTREGTPQAGNENVPMFLVAESLVHEKGLIGKSLPSSLGSIVAPPLNGGRQDRAVAAAATHSFHTLKNKRPQTHPMITLTCSTDNVAGPETI